MIYIDSKYQDIYFYTKEGILHRLNGPAVIDIQRETWYQYGKIHREDGPARIYFHKKLKVEYWINDKYLPEKSKE